MATIRQLRLTVDMTQQELADALGVKQTVISRWERGSVKPSAAALTALANVLGTKVEEITLVDRMTAKSVLTKEGYDSTTPAERRAILKYEQVKSLSKWGRYPSTYSILVKRIPADWWKQYPADHLADVIDLLKAQYDEGVMYGKGDKEA